MRIDVDQALVDLRLLIGLLSDEHRPDKRITLPDRRLHIQATQEGIVIAIAKFQGFMPAGGRPCGGLPQS